MSRKEQRPGGVKLTAKTARTLAMQEFGTARGLTKSTSFVGAYFMEVGNLRIEICADAACIAVRVVLAHGTGSSVKYFDPDTLQENFKAILERQVNGGAWAQVYKGINRSYTDAITFGWTSITYRVKAYDSAGAESAYNTSATRTVVNNHAPVISGTDSNLGAKTAAFAQSYSVTDEDSGQTLTVTEYIDGTQKRSYTATSGQNYSFNITAAEWVKLLNGSHTLKIVAADNYGGSATRTYTFTKNETEIELTLATPLTADDMVTKGIMSVVRQIPAGAKFTVEVCNNGNDASPTWEDVTQNVVSGSKFFLSNTTKTASAWGYNFRIKVKRGTATGDCFITSAGGNFE